MTEYMYEGEIVSYNVEKREVYGRILPYNETIQHNGRDHTYGEGALADVDWSKTVLLLHHDPKQPIGKMTALEHKPDGAYGTFKVSKTRKGDETLNLAVDGVLSFSVGVDPGDRSKDGIYNKVKRLLETSLVSFAAFPSAEVLSVHSPDIKEVSELDTPAEATAEVAAIDPEELNAKFADIGEKLTRLESYATAPTPKKAGKLPSAVDYFTAKVEARLGYGDKLEKMQEAIETYAPLDDVTGELGSSGDLGTFVQEEFIASQLVNVLNTKRPLFRNVGSFAAPRSGYMGVPRITESVVVAARGAQKTDIPSRAIISTLDQYEAEWFAGGVDIAIELIQTAEVPSGVVAFVVNELLRAYRKTTEAALAAHLNDEGTGFDYTGSTLSTATLEALSEQLAEASLEIDNATDAPATKLAVPWTIWPKLVAMADANDHRQFVPGDRSEGSVGLTSQEFRLPASGITIFGAAVNSATLFNEDSLKAVDYGPIQVDATNVLQMGRDVGILGRTLYFPRIPSGVVVFGEDPASS